MFFHFLGHFSKKIKKKSKREFFLHFLPKWAEIWFIGSLGGYNQLLWVDFEYLENWLIPGLKLFFSHNFGQKQPKNISVGIGLGQFSGLSKSTQNMERLLPKDPNFQISAYWSKKWRTWNIFFWYGHFSEKWPEKWENIFFLKDKHSNCSWPLSLAA